MPISPALMDEGEWSLRYEGMPQQVKDSIDLSGYAFAPVYFTRHRWEPGSIDTNGIVSDAVWTGLLLDQDDDSQTIGGPGLAWWIGGENNGDLYTGQDATSAAGTFSARLAANVISFANGLTNGAVSATTGTMSLGFKGGQTRRETLDTLCAAFGYEWRINPDGTLDADTKGNLFQSGQVILTQNGGRRGSVTGIAADLAVPRKSVRDYRTDFYEDWNNGVNLGSASNTPTITWRNAAADAPVLAAYNTAQPRGRIRGRGTVAKISAWIFNGQTRASAAARREADDNNSYEFTVNAQLTDNMWDWIGIGDTVYVHDQPRRLIDVDNEVNYRGQTLHPTTLRAVSAECPITDDMGVYVFRYSPVITGWVAVNISRYVVPDQTTTSIELSHNLRYHRRNARPHRISRAQAHRIARYLHRLNRNQQRLQAYYDSLR